MWPSTGARARRPPNRPPPEVLTQARPLVANLPVTRKAGNQTVRTASWPPCDGTAGSHGVGDPCGPPSLILFYPSPPSHAHTQCNPCHPSLPNR